MYRYETCINSEYALEYLKKPLNSMQFWQINEAMFISWQWTSQNYTNTSL